MFTQGGEFRRLLVCFGGGHGRVERWSTRKFSTEAHPTVFRLQMGRNGKHNIGLIIAQSYNHKTGTRARPYLTVKPLARDLGLPVHTDW